MKRATSRLMGMAFMAMTSHVAQAYPEMVRHGISSCGTCHVSPTGGGLVSPYGRELSSEFLRMTDSNDVANPADGAESDVDYLGDFDVFHGAVALPDWLNIGGDFRATASSVRAPDYSSNKVQLSQADIEAALTFDRLDLVLAGGRSEATEKTDVRAISRRHYLALKPSEDLVIRAGRFFPAFGIGVAEPNVGVRKDLGFGLEMETYNIEAAYIQENYEIFVDGIFGRPDKPELDREEGFSAKVVCHLKDSHSVGMNIYQGKNDSGERRIYGLYGILGFTEQLAVLTEFDLQEVVSPEPFVLLVRGRSLYNKISFEISQGVNLIGTGQQSFTDLAHSSTLTNTFGLGAQVFPVPHLEVQVEYQKIRDPRVSSDSLMDTAALQVHYYL